MPGMFVCFCFNAFVHRGNATKSIRCGGIRWAVFCSREGNMSQNPLNRFVSCLFAIGMDDKVIIIISYTLSRKDPEVLADTRQTYRDHTLKKYLKISIMINDIMWGRSAKKKFQNHDRCFSKKICRRKKQHSYFEKEMCTPTPQNIDFDVFFK